MLTVNVGIGTASPAAKLNVYTDAGRDFRVDHGTANRTILSTDRGMIVKAAGGYSLELDTGSDTGLILFKDNGVTHSQFNASGNLALGTTTHFTVGGAAKLSVAGILSIGASNADMSYIRRQSAGNYAWQTYDNNNTGSIQLQPYGGNVGIGTTAPSTFNSRATAGNTQLHVHNNKTGDAAVLRLEGGRTSANDAAQVLLANGGYIGSAIKMHSSGSQEGDMRFYVSGASSGDSLSEAMRIGTNGAVSIGTTTAAGAGGLLVDNDIKTNSRFGVGSAGNTSTPAFYHVSDADTGVYFPAANNIALVAGGLEAFKAASTGYIEAIGASQVRLSLGSTGTAGTNTANWIRGTGNLLGFNSAGGGFHWEIGGTQRMIMSSAGNVGIGTSSPNDGKLQVYGNSSSDWAGYFYNQNANGIGLHVETDSYGTEQLLRLSSLTGSGGSNTVRMVVRADGNVGIGTTAPTSKLEVSVTQSDTMTDDTAAFAIKGNGGDGILMGQRATTPYAAWIAAGYLPNIGTSHNYPLTLQPHGGNVGIGTTSPISSLHLR